MRKILSALSSTLQGGVRGGLGMRSEPNNIKIPLNTGLQRFSGIFRKKCFLQHALGRWQFVFVNITFYCHFYCSC